MGYDYPKVIPMEVWNTSVIFADNGELRYDPDTGFDRQPGVVILDLETINLSASLRYQVGQKRRHHHHSGTGKGL